MYWLRRCAFGSTHGITNHENRNHGVNPREVDIASSPPVIKALLPVPTPSSWVGNFPGMQMGSFSLTKTSQKACRMAASGCVVVVCTVLAGCSARFSFVTPRNVGPLGDGLNFALPSAHSSQTVLACRGPRCEQLQQAGAGPQLSGLPVLAPAILVAALGVFAAKKRHTGRRSGTSRPQLHAIGSVENKKFLGDWASLAPSESTRWRSAFAAGADSFTFTSARSKTGRSAQANSTTMAAQQQQLSGFQTWTGLTPGKEYRLQTMTVDNVAADTTTIRSLDWDRDRFDIEFALERGTTYNSYVVRGSEKVAIVDTSHEKFESLFFEALDKEVDYATVGYLVVSHTEPDHSGLISKVVEKALAAGNEDFTVVGSKVCIQFLENLIHSPFKSKVVANGNKLDLGGGHELEFIIAPNLHWPDTMFTFDHGTGLLYTCDAFGMHYCSDKLVDEEGVKELLPHYELYYDCLMKPNARSVLNALKKTKDMEFHTIATGHGPMLTQSTLEWVEKYRSWSDKAMENLGPTVAVFWVSNYAESERFSQIFAHGLTTSGITVEMHDLNAIDAFELTECLAQASVLVVMCPPQGQNAAQSAIGSIVAGAKEKNHRFLILESGAADQEPVDLLTQRFVQQNIPQALPAIKAEQTQTSKLLQTFEEAGMSLGKQLSKKAKVDKAKSLNRDMERALGRLSSSIYVVTAQKAGIEHAMVASWVTPASQSPLGVTLSVAKDRAMEPLLRVGDSFTINFLEEGKSKGLMKHFLQKFAPGANRLEGVDRIAGSNGAAVLREACAFLECRIISRMDATDHWIAYAEVNGGSVAKKEAETAVHHRKTGTYY